MTMPQDMNREPGSQGLSGMSYDKATSSSVQEDTAGFRETAARQGSSAYEGLKEGAQSLRSSLGAKAKDQAAGYVEEGKHAVTENLDTFAQAIRRASDELSQGEQTVASQIVRQAAGGLESLSRSIEGANVDDMITFIRRFGRRNPAAFIGGAVLVGLALGRFARASSPQRSSQWRDDDWQDSASWRNGGRSGRDDWRGGSDDSWRGGGDEGYAPRPYAGSAYPAGESSTFPSGNRSFGDTPAPSQGYAGGGMSTDPIQSSGPSSERDESVTSSSYSGGSAQPGSISTGGQS
jgi:hypothetical protein